MEHALTAAPHWIGESMGPRASLDVMAKGEIPVLARNQPPALRSVVSHCTDSFEKFHAST